MITIYNKYRKPKVKSLVGEGSVRRYSLMKDDYIKLKFSLAENVPLLIGDYVDLSQYTYEDLFGDDQEAKERFTNDSTMLFVLNRNYYPKYNDNTGGWDYDVQIDAYYKLWDNYILKYDQSSGVTEAAFQLTDTINQHVRLVVDNLKGLWLKFGELDFDSTIEADASNKGMKSISYNAVTIYGALDAIASAFECEWWVNGRFIHFGVRKKDNEAISLALDKNIASASTSKSDNTHATRLYAFGGTTNVPKHYRDKLTFKVSSKGEDYIFANNAVYPSMFASETEATDEQKSVERKHTNNDASVRGDARYSGEVTLDLGKVYLEPQMYYIGISELIPQLRFRKLLTHGFSYGEFSINFSYSLRLQKGNEVVTLCSKSYTHKGSPKDLLGEQITHSSSYVTSGGGYIKAMPDGSFELDKGVGKNDSLTIYQINKYSEPYVSVLSSTKIGDKRSMLAPFMRSERRYAYGEKFEEGQKFYPLTDWATHLTDSWYTLFLGDYTTNDQMLVIRDSWEASGAYVTSYDNKAVSLPFIGEGYEPLENIKEGGEYNLQFSIKVDSTENVVWYVDSSNPMLLFDVTLPAFNMTLKKDKASSATTIISYTDSEGLVHEEDVIINPENRYFETDSYGNAKEGTDTNSAKIKFKSGNVPLDKDDVFEMPNIVRSRVPDAYFSSKASGVTNAVVQKNIMLPEGTPYVQAQGVSDADVVESVMVYDWIYPKTIMQVVNVEDAKVDDGEGGTIDTYDIVINVNGYNHKQWTTDDTLYIIFQSGDLTGFRFELDYLGNVEYVEDEDTKIYPKFRIVPNEDYGAMLPNENKKPNNQKQDDIILEGIDIQFFDENAVGEAEALVKKQAEKDILSMSKENKVIDITLYSKDAYNRGRIPLGSIVELEGVLSDSYESRIIGFEEKLDIPYDSPKYIIGESSYYSRVGAVESKLEEVNKGSHSLMNVGASGGSSVDIIRAGEGTEPTDKNVLSALRVETEFLHKNQDDSVNANVDFEKDIKVKGNTQVKDINVNGDASISGNSTVDGEQTVKGLQTLHSGFQTANFSEVAGQIKGAQLTLNGIMTLAGLKAMSLEVYELILNKVRAQAGQYVFSNAANIDYCEYVLTDGSIVEPSEYNDGEIEEVHLSIKKDEVNTTMPFIVGDIIYGNVNSIGDGIAGGQCVMHITGVDDASMVVTAKLYPVVGEGEIMYDSEGNIRQDVVVENIPPVNGMAVAQRGNENGVDGRCTAIFIDTQTANIYMLRNLTGPNIDKSNYATINGLLPTDLYNEVHEKYDFIKSDDPVMYAEYGIFRNILEFDHLGNAIQRENNRGEWVADTTYYSTPSYCDVVSYDGQLWKCIASSTTAQPQSDSSDWILLVAKGADGKASTPNLLDNTGFDSVGADGAPLSWSKSDDTTVKIVDKAESGLGQNVVSISHLSGESKMITQQLTSGRLQPSTWYTLSFYIKRVAGNTAYLSLDNYNKNAKYYFDGTAYRFGYDNYSFDVSTNWEKHTATFQTDSSVTNVLIGFGTKDYYRKTEIQIGLVKLELASDQSAPEKSTSSDWLRNTDDYTSESIYLAGNWDSSKTYRKENNCVPIVKYNSQYYRLTRVESTGNTPSDLTHWRPFQYFQYLFAEFLMANNAKFGSDKGAIFFKKWLFSQMGRTRDGVNKSYDEFIKDKEEYEDVFDADGNFTGDFVPNFSLDMEDGEMSLLKLKENYVDCTGMTYIDMDELGYYNIIVEPKVQDKRFGFSSPLIILPQQGTDGNVRDKQGARISIVAKADQYYLKQYSEDNSGTSGKPTGKNYQCGAFALIAADTLSSMSDEPYDYGNYQSNWIIHNGYRSKYIYLGAGDSVTLRLVVESVGNTHYNYWYIEAGNVYHGTDNIVLVNNAKSTTDYEGTPFEGDTIGVIDTMKYTNGVDRNDNWRDSHENGYKRCLFCSPAAQDNRGTLVAGNTDCRTIILSINSDGFVQYSNGNVYYRHVDNRTNGDTGFDTTRLS